MPETTVDETTSRRDERTGAVDAMWGDVAIPTRVLVLGMAHEDGSIHGRELYPVAEAVGQTADQVRSCLRRLVSDGLFLREGEGRDAIFRATEAGRAAVATYVERTRLAYVQDAQGRGWDRRWRLVAFGVPEAQRTARDAFRDRLRVLGGAPLQGGLYVSPHDWFRFVAAEADRLGVAASVSWATTDDLVVGGSRDPRDIAARLWPLDDVARRYDTFLAEYGNLPQVLHDLRARKQRIAESDYLAGALAMVVAFRHCFDHDPLLPPELLPRPWPGRTAREIVAESYRLGLLSRQQHTQPALFRHFAEVASTVR